MNMKHWPDYHDRNPDELLRELCRDVLARPQEPAASPLRKHVDSELAVICERGYARMFLFLLQTTEVRITECLVRACGALAGSVTAYLLGISDFNPLDHGLLFESFIHFRQKSPATPALETSEEGCSAILRQFQGLLGHDRVGIVHDQYWDYIYLSSANIRSLCMADWDKDGNLVVGIDWAEADKLGMLCIAIRKSKMLTALADSVKELPPNALGIPMRPGLTGIPLDDTSTYEFLNSKDADTFFALRDNQCARGKRAACQNFAELTAFLALNMPHHAERRALYYGETVNRIAALADFPVCQKHLRETRGILLYQEQFTKIVAEISGLPREDAFAAYQSSWKRKSEEVDEWKRLLIAGGLANGYGVEKLSVIMDCLLAAAQGNLSLKAYCVSQALQLYRLAYCRAHYG